MTGPVDMIGGGPFNWEPGEWTDDTQMAICIAENSHAREIDLNAVGDGFISWADDVPDIGIQTRRVLSRASSGDELSAIALEYHRRHPRNSAGNGSLMRTGVVALPFLGHGAAAASEAVAVSNLTHADRQCADACVLWTLAVGAAIEGGAITDIRAGLEHVPSERHDRWIAVIDEAESREPGVFTPNGYVIKAFQAAWSSITHTRSANDHLRSALVQAVRIGNDTDTVAAIAGTLLGAAYGASRIPNEWVTELHGWPGYDTDDLRRVARSAAGVDS